MKKLINLLFVVVATVCNTATAQQFQIDHTETVSLVNAGDINKIDGAITFTSVGVYDGSLSVSSTSPPTIGGGVNANGSGILAIDPVGDASLFCTGATTWVNIPTIADAQDVLPFGPESLLVCTNTGQVYKGPGSSAILPGPVFSYMGVNPVSSGSGNTYPAQKLVTNQNGQGFLALHGGSSTNFASGFIFNDVLSWRTIETPYYNDGIVDATRNGSSVDYLSLVRPVVNPASFSGYMYLSVDSLDNTHTYAIVSAGVHKMANYDDARTLFAGPPTMYLIPQSGTPNDGVQQFGKSLSMYNKYTGTVEGLMTVYYGGVADIEVKDGVVAVAINVATSATSALIYCGGETLSVSEPTIFYLRPSTTTSIVKGEVEKPFKISNSGSSNTAIIANKTGVITITTMSAQEFKYNVQTGESITLNDLSPGMYVARFLDDDNIERFSVTFIKQ